MKFLPIDGARNFSVMGIISQKYLLRPRNTGSDALNDEVVQNSFASRDDRFLELVYCLIFIFLKRKMAFK